MDAYYEKHLSFGVDVPLGQEKFRELVIYIAQRCQKAEYFGATKLNKILYRVDFEAFRRLGRPVTGAVYFRLPNGPAPKALVPVRDSLVSEGAILIEDRPMGNRVQHRVVPLRDPDVSLFTAAELRLTDEVVKDLWSATADEASNASHDIVWSSRQDRDLIPYEAGRLDNGPLTDDDIKRTRELVKEFGWLGD